MPASPLATQAITACILSAVSQPLVCAICPRASLALSRRAMIFRSLIASFALAASCWSPDEFIPNSDLSRKSLSLERFAAPA